MQGKGRQEVKRWLPQNVELSLLRRGQASGGGDVVEGEREVCLRQALNATHGPALSRQLHQAPIAVLHMALSVSYHTSACPAARVAILPCMHMRKLRLMTQIGLSIQLQGGCQLPARRSCHASSVMAMRMRAVEHACAAGWAGLVYQNDKAADESVC